MHRPGLALLALVPLAIAIGGGAAHGLYALAMGPPCPPVLSSDAPPCILARGAAHLRFMLGSSRFDRDVALVRTDLAMPPEFCVEHPEECGPRAREPDYLLAYRLRLPQGHEQTLGLHLDPRGTVQAEERVPRCRLLPRECTQFLTEQQATNLAARTGLEQGVRPWEPKFGYHERLGTFVWRVESARSWGGGTAEGTAVVLDANDGRVLGAYGWGFVAN